MIVKLSLKDLLEKALESTDDSDFERELRSRVRLINQKPKNLVNCCVCGKGFMTRMIELCLQETCIGCKNKKT